MIYQLPLNVTIYLIIIDLTLIGFTLLTIKISRNAIRAIALSVILILFGGFSIIKLIGVSPEMIASSPGEIKLKSSSSIGQFYLARSNKNSYSVFWKENVNSNESILSIEMEGIYPNHLRIIKEVNGEYKELKPNLVRIGNIFEPIEIHISDSEFQPLSKMGQMAIEDVWKRDLGNYLSNLISLLFIVTFIWILKKQYYLYVVK